MLKELRRTFHMVGRENPMRSLSTLGWKPWRRQSLEVFLRQLWCGYVAVRSKDRVRQWNRKFSGAGCFQSISLMGISEPHCRPRPWYL